MPSCRRAVPVPAGVPLVLLCCVVLLAGCHGSAKVERLPRPHDLPRTDTRARDDLLALLSRGGRATWWVDSDFVRTVGTRTLDDHVTEVNRPPDHLVVGLGGLRGTLDGHALSCTPATGGPLCSGAAAPAVSGAAAYAALTDPTTGSYALRNTGGRLIAGLAARCFRLDWNERGTNQPFGTRATACFSSDGVPLALDAERAGASDTTTARTVRRTFTRADLDALLEPYLGAGPSHPVAPSTTTTVAPAVPGP
jgi:hypothetical protein